MPLSRFGRRGAAGQQYALIVGLIAVVAILAIASLGVTVRSLFTSTSNTLIRATNSAAAITGATGGGTAAAPGGPWQFDTCGASGFAGPASCPYAATTLAGQVTVPTQGYQLWTVPATGTYQIDARGARGGNASGFSCTGGLGARALARFSLVQGDKLLILVGQQGGSRQYSGGGGGGTFVTKGSDYATSTFMIAAGGGGAGNASSFSSNGTYGCDTEAGCGGAIGTNGSAGNGGTGPNSHCASGGGFVTGEQYNGTCNYGRASGFRTGGLGGDAANCNETLYDADGGFGGGGSPGCSYGGGGGGYSGGSAKGGGGSYALGATNTPSYTAGFNAAADGQVTITFISP